MGKLEGAEALIGKLTTMGGKRFDKSINKSLKQMYNRAPRLTPIDSGELLKSRGITRADKSLNSSGEFYYDADYANPVEFGHVDPAGRFVNGQYFMRQNVEIQTTTFLNDVLQELKEE